MVDNIAPPTPEELEEIKGYASSLAGKAMLTHLQHLLAGSPELAGRISALTPASATSLEVTPHDTHVHIHIALLPTKRGFKTEILVPSEHYAAAMYQAIRQVLAMSTAFWSQFCLDHGELVGLCKTALGSELVLTTDKANPNSVWFSPDSVGESECVSIVCYYMENGKIITPKRR